MPDLKKTEGMNGQNIPSPGPCFGHDDDELCRAYRSLLLSSLKSSFSSFVVNFEIQNGPLAERGRVAAIDFKEKEKATVTPFTSSSQLKSFLDREPPISHAPSQPSRKRLYVLEDIARNTIEVLGSRLRVPPSVFAAHWADPATSRETFDDACLLSNGPKYFRLNYHQLHQINEDYTLGAYLGRNGNVPRWLQLLDRGRRSESSEHHVSFWGTGDGLGSWIGEFPREVMLELHQHGDIALLLVDPLITKAQLYPRGDRVHLDHPNTGEDALLYPQPMSTNILSPNSADWESSGAAKFGSMFDGILEFYEHASHPVMKDPRSATLASRRIALCMWRGYLRSREEEFYLVSNAMHYHQSPDHPHGWFYTWGLSWQVEVFRKLVFSKTVIEGINANLQSIFHTLGLNSDDRSVVDQYEASEWRSLQDRGNALAMKFDSLIAEYVQEASIQQSRGVGRLTKLATVLVPFSITAGIFSMGDDYLVGKRLFWVFWAVAIPLVLLFSIVVFTSLVSLLWDGAENLIWKSRRAWPLPWKRND